MFNATFLLNGSDERQQSGWINAVGCWFESGQCGGPSQLILSIYKKQVQVVIKTASSNERALAGHADVRTCSCNTCCWGSHWIYNLVAFSGWCEIMHVQPVRLKSEKALKGEQFDSWTVSPAEHEAECMKTLKRHLSIKARNLCVFVCVCVCASNISADQDQTNLRLSTWLLRVSRVCDFAFVWTAMIPLVNYFINALQIPLALLTIATTVMCAPEPTATPPTLETSRFIPAAARAGPGFCRRFGPFLFFASKPTVVD